MSGLSAAHELQNALPNAKITLFEKSRGVGRLATRYKDVFQFEFGAPHFRVKSDSFTEFLTSFLENGTVKTWQPKHQVVNSSGMQALENAYPYYISSPKMTSLGRAIASELKADIQYKTRVASLERPGDKWLLTAEDGQSVGEFDWVICTAPTEQAIDLLPTDFTHFSEVKNAKIDACFTLMLGWAQDTAPDALKYAEWDMLSVELSDSPIEKLVLENTKQDNETLAISLTAFSKNDWAEQHVDDDQDMVRNELVTAVGNLLEINSTAANHTDMHRWRYAKPHVNQAWECLVDVNSQLIAAGDWCLNGSVEGAFLSGQSAATAIIDVIMSA